MLTDKPLCLAGCSAGYPCWCPQFPQSLETVTKESSSQSSPSSTSALALNGNRLLPERGFHHTEAGVTDASGGSDESCGLPPQRRQKTKGRRKTKAQVINITNYEVLTGEMADCIKHLLPKSTDPSSAEGENQFHKVVL